MLEQVIKSVSQIKRVNSEYNWITQRQAQLMLLHAHAYTHTPTHIFTIHAYTSPCSDPCH